MVTLIEKITKLDKDRHYSIGLSIDDYNLSFKENYAVISILDIADDKFVLVETIPFTAPKQITEEVIYVTSILTNHIFNMNVIGCGYIIMNDLVKTGNINVYNYENSNGKKIYGVRLDWGITNKLHSMLKKFAKRSTDDTSSGMLDAVKYSDFQIRAHTGLLSMGMSLYALT